MISAASQTGTVELFLRRYFPFLLLTGILINATGLFNDILEPDGALYASIAKNMVLSGDWVNLIYDNTDWLDKPHFPFWIEAASFKLFGISAFAYKFPAFLFWLIGLRYTRLTAKEFYSTKIADVTALVYSIALHGMLANFDVRAEAYLTALIIAAIYYLQRATSTNRLLYFVFAALLTACAIMTKGIFILITICSGFVLYWLLSGAYRQFLNFRWLVYVILVFIFLSPELYCLYVQFDMHPEKIIFGKQGVSGIRFFFWDSQFGRFFNNGPIKGKGDPFFFLHTSIWAFLPWGPLLFIAIAKLFRRPRQLVQSPQSVIVISMLVSFIVFSLSRFQLPHYIVVLFPHFSMITAGFLVGLFSETQMIKGKRAVVIYFNTIIVIAAIAATAFCFVFPHYWKWPVILFMLSALLFALFYQKGFNGIFIKAFAFAVILYPFLNLHFFPSILNYQAGMKAAKWVNNESKYEGPVIIYGNAIPSLQFYAKTKTKTVNSITELTQAIASEKNPVIVYADIAEEENIRAAGLSPKLLNRFESFPVSRLTLKFLDPARRNKMTNKMALFMMADDPNPDKFIGKNKSYD